jgi:TRAP-type C4-dicarboxylate transport system substrate-binding protein
MIAFLESGRTVLALAPILAIGALPPLLPAAGAGDRKPIRLATLAPQGSSSHQILLAMGEKWRDAPEGGVKLIVNAGGLMGGESDVVAKMRAGQVQAGLLTAVGLGEIDRSVLALQDVPMLFKTLDEVAYVRDKLRPSLEKRIGDKGFVALFWGDVGWVKYFSRTPIVHPADLKTVKLFAWAGSTAQIDLEKSLGLNPVPLEPNDILPSLRTGLLDAVSTAPYYAQVLQYYEPAPHMLDLNWAPLVGALVVTKKAWETCPPELQKAMRAAAEKSGEELTTRNRKESEESVDAMKKRGLVVHPVTAELEAEWRAFVEPVYPKLRGMDVPEEVFDEVQKDLAEYRKGKSSPLGGSEPKKVDKASPR